MNMKMIMMMMMMMMIRLKSVSHCGVSLDYLRICVVIDSVRCICCTPITDLHISVSLVLFFCLSVIHIFTTFMFNKRSIFGN